jgi:hypothetical protein
MKAKLAWALALAALLALSGVPAAAQGQTPTAITDVRQESGERSTRLVLESSGPLAYTYYSPDPLTLVVDIPEVDASKLPSRITVGTREVESLRVTTLARGDGRGIARFEVRLASLVPLQDLLEGPHAAPRLRAPGRARRLPGRSAGASTGCDGPRGGRTRSGGPGSGSAARPAGSPACPRRVRSEARAPAGDADPRRRPRERDGAGGDRHPG